MKRSLFRVGAALATLAFAGTLAACSNNVLLVLQREARGLVLGFG